MQCNIQEDKKIFVHKQLTFINGKEKSQQQQKTTRHNAWMNNLMPLLEYCIAVASKFSLISLTDKKMSFQYEFQLSEETKVHWCKVWQVRRLGVEHHFMFCEKIMNQQGGMRQCCHDGTTIFFPPQIRPFSPHCPSQPFLHLQKILLVHHLATR